MCGNMGGFWMDVERQETSIFVSSGEKDEAVKELQRLLACYQLATFDDRNVVWAVLNKYATQID